MLEGQQRLQEANALVAQTRLSESVALYRQAAALVPEWHLPHFNLGAILLRLGHEDDACEAFEHAIAREPNCWKSHFNLALLHLRKGRYVEGWKHYDWRFRSDGRPAPRRGREVPVWDGRQSLAGETLLLCAEQGVGDLIQFARFVPSIAARAGRILLECPASLARLMSTLDGIDGLVDPTCPCPEASLQFPVMSLPRVFGRDFTPCPVPTPYLASAGDDNPALESLWKRRDLKVGVVWNGDPDNPQNPIRSCRPADFSILSKIDGVQLVSLQYRDDGLTSRELNEHGILSLGSAVGDFASVASIVERLDLTITIDTAVAHLAGALDRPAWVLLSRPSDWRWPDAGSSTPWYDSLRLFHQRRAGDWAGVFETVAERLQTLSEIRNRNIPPRPVAVLRQ